MKQALLSAVTDKPGVYQGVINPASIYYYRSGAPRRYNIDGVIDASTIGETFNARLVSIHYGTNLNTLPHISTLTSSVGSTSGLKSGIIHVSCAASKSITGKLEANTQMFEYIRVNDYMFTPHSDGISYITSGGFYVGFFYNLYGQDCTVEYKFKDEYIT